MQVSVKNQNGEALNSIDLNDAVFNVPMNPTLVHQAMVIYQGNKRQGTSDTKTRAQVSGGGRKPWIQKHTGRARQGSTRAPQWRHGGVVFGPHPRSYRAALPKRMKRQALRCVLSEKARQDRLFCLDSTNTIDGKTKSMAQLLANLSIAGSALVVTMRSDKEVVSAAHNLGKIWTLPANQLNAQELLARDTVIMTVEAARWVEETYSSEPHGRRGLKWAALAGSSDVAVAEPEVAEKPATEAAAPEAPKPRRRAAAATTEPAEEMTAEAAIEEKPKPRRRRAAAAMTEAAGETSTETSGETSTEETPKPRRREGRTTASTADEVALETEQETPEEKA